MPADGMPLKGPTPVLSLISLVASIRDGHDCGTTGRSREEPKTWTTVSQRAGTGRCQRRRRCRRRRPFRRRMLLRCGLLQSSRQSHGHCPRDPGGCQIAVLARGPACGPTRPPSHSSFVVMTSSSSSSSPLGPEPCKNTLADIARATPQKLQ